ncbi:MAG: TauD/TfdA family dioxygenase [Betaproteobacteria bacterium]|nr:TauD/TfdA family dioxygenase [Betaproteobacteria bacterium]
MRHSPVVVDPLPAALGAEIRGVDLSAPMPDAAFQDVEAALHKHGFLCFRNQRLDDPGQMAFSRLWGDHLEIHPILRHAKKDCPEIYILSNILDERGEPLGAVDAAQFWHTDLSYTHHPSRVSILHAAEVPFDANGRPLGDTEFASTTKAYEALPEDVKRRISGLKAMHHALKPKKQGNFMKLKGKETAGLDGVVHPVVRTHPFTGKKCLYVNWGFTSHVLDMPQEESDDLLAYLFDFMSQAQFRSVHKWAVGDVLIWDNCSSIHQGVGNYALPQRRLIYRTIVRGGVPY